MEIDIKRIEDKIVEDAVERIVSDDELSGRLTQTIDRRINQFFSERAQPQIDAAVEEAIKTGFNREFCRVSPWGERQGEPTTIAKELEKMVAGYWNVRVDRNGKPSTNGYGEHLTRAEYVMTQIVAADFNKEMQQHVVNVGGALKDKLRASLHETVNELLSSVFRVKSMDDETLKRTGSACIDPKQTRPVG